MSHYKVRIINSNAQIIRVSDELEEEIKHGYIPVNKAESIIRGLNQGWSIKDFDELAD